MFIYGIIYWLYDHRYVLAQIHNAIKVVPANFIIYFSTPVPKDPFLYGFGYYLLLKIPSILADMGISVIIFKVLQDLTKNPRKAFAGLCLYLFNPVTIFLSSVWGQNDSLVALFGLASFVFLFYKKVEFSIVSLFISLYLKPNWIIFVPLYLFLLILLRVDKKKLLLGLTISALVFLITTLPFSGRNIFSFSQKVVFENMLPSAKGVTKASTSAFNLYSLFYRVDYTLASQRFFNIPLSTWGFISLVFFNLFTFKCLLRRTKNKVLYFGIVAIFMVGTGMFLFSTNMLERYFFPIIAPLTLIMALESKVLLYGVIINLILFLNLIWSFYRRATGPIDHLFSDYNFLLIRVLSFFFLVSWFFLIKQTKFLSLSDKK